jgi:hypothetical protein
MAGCTRRVAFLSTVLKNKLVGRIGSACRARGAEIVEQYV